jgi:transcriptional regulator with XRE-family HTH domain
MARLVRELRELTGLTQEKFTAKLGVSFATVNRWENGKTVPSKLAQRQFEQFCKDHVKKESLNMNEDTITNRMTQVIRRDVLVKKHSLNERQTKALGQLIEHGKLTIQDFEARCPTVNRRSLQPDLKRMLDKNLIVAEGATHHQEYRLL